MDVVGNIKEIRLKKGINQQIIAEALGVDIAVVSNIETGKRDLKVRDLEIIANCLGVDVLYLLTYPKRFIDSTVIEKAEKVSITFEVSPEKRDLLLKMVTEDK